MTIVPQRAAAQPVPNKGTEAIDPVYRQIRDLVYKTSGIYKAEEKLYLLADGCGRRMKQLATRTPREYWDRLNAAPFRDAELRELLNAGRAPAKSMQRRRDSGALPLMN